MERFQEIQDIDYLYASTRIRSLERSLMTTERLRRMAEAKTDDELLKVLEECGYGEIGSLSQVPAAIARKRAEVLDDMFKMAPDKTVVQIFLLKYDYHNLKAILKGEAAKTEYESSLMEGGRIPLKKMIASVSSAVIGADGELTDIMKHAANEARDVLARTGDPRLSDTVLDRAAFAEMKELAEESQKAHELKSDFLMEYVKLKIDGINMRTAVRLKRMNQDSSQLSKYFIEGGSVPLSRLRVEITPESLISIFETSPLKEAAHSAADALREGKGLARVDTQVENALLNYLKNAKYIPFGEMHIIAHVAARETEFTAINMVLAARKAGLLPEEIMERLRETYV